MDCKGETIELGNGVKTWNQRKEAMVEWGGELYGSSQDQHEIQRAMDECLPRSIQSIWA